MNCRTGQPLAPTTHQIAPDAAQLLNRIEEAQEVLDGAHFAGGTRSNTAENDGAEPVNGFEAGHCECDLNVLRWCALDMERSASLALFDALLGPICAPARFAN